MAKDPSTGAITSRTKTVYDCPQLKLFFVTGQPTGVQRFDGLGERKASIVCTPYHQLDAQQHADLAAKAEPLTGSHVDISTNMHTGQLEFYDRLTQVTSRFPLQDLDPGIQQNLRPRPQPGTGLTPS